jgi:2-dehydropantoate 2-reductase
MKILVYGAGVIGSIYAARLYETGEDVTLLARDQHYERLQKNGIVLHNVLTGKQSTSFVNLKEELDSDDSYDLIIITVRLDQVETIVPSLKQNRFSPLITLMFNFPESLDQLANELKPKHVIAGFPGVGGILHDDHIEYIQINQQQTAIGELDGRSSNCIKEIKALFSGAGFKTTILAFLLQSLWKMATVLN